MSTPKPLEGYRSYKDLPQLAGLCTVQEAAMPGLSVEECVRRLKRFHYAFKRLHQILVARITAEPIYELKTGFAHHAYLCAEHVQALRTRIAEMREPPLGLEDVPHPALEAFFDEILAAPTTEELIVGLYGKAIYALRESLSLDGYRKESNSLTDAPSHRILKFAWWEAMEMFDWGEKAIDCLVDHSVSERMSDWLQLLDNILLAAGGLDGAEQETSQTFQRCYSTSPYKYDLVPKRDERFQDPWNQGVNAEVFLYDESMPAKAKVLMMLYKRLREIDVPEMMASIITQTPGKPWGYYRDMTRQLWDEARHAMMGEVGFVALGVDWTQARITFNWSYRLNTECTPMERHGVLYFIEQGLMPRTGKRYEFEVASVSGLPLAATIQDFDWADEVLHSQIGRQWYVPEFESLQKAMDYGDVAWSKILSNWAVVKERGLTEHTNWWPSIYSQSCEAAGVSPDEQVLAFATTYEGTRADLQRVAAE